MSNSMKEFRNGAIEPQDVVDMELNSFDYAIQDLIAAQNQMIIAERNRCIGLIEQALEISNSGRNETVSRLLNAMRTGKERL